MTDTKKKEATAGKAEEDTGKVPVRLLYDDDHKRPLFVCVNGVSTKIPRGKVVMVSPEIAEAVENARDQEEAAIRYQDSVAYRDPENA